MFFFDPNVFYFHDPCVHLMGFASWYVRHAYNKWSQVRATSGLTGHQAAQRLISTGNLYGVQVQGRRASLSDHYDPRNKTLFLSQGVHNSPSVAAVAIAAHELGHAMQDAEEYFPMKIRSFLVPAVNIGSNLGWILIMIGLFLRMTNLPGSACSSSQAAHCLRSPPCPWNLTLRPRKGIALLHRHHPNRRGTTRCQSGP